MLVVNHTLLSKRVNCKCNPNHYSLMNVQVYCRSGVVSTRLALQYGETRSRMLYLNHAAQVLTARKKQHT